MRPYTDIHDERLRLIGRLDGLLTYRAGRLEVGDHHGVQDASSDLRDVEAAIGALEWVMGWREKVGV